MESVLKALGDRTRLRILGLLMTGDVCVCHLHESLRLPQPTVSRHLAYLRRTGLVESKKDGLWVHYRLCEPTDKVLRTIVASVTHCVTHLPTTTQDRKRLERVTGCSGETTGAAPEAACC
jgi:ArsR family transcriptional regulator